MKEHALKCVALGTAQRIANLGRASIGYPMKDGSWSFGDVVFIDGEKLVLHIQSKNGGKTHATVEAVVKDERSTEVDEFGWRRGCFVAKFSPVRF